jgi:NAD(P)-dependent dehydrogenase (short-subunit alcohol dehydrogenase family)
VSDQEFAGKVALITGGTRGIGKGIAAELVSRGAKVTITARKPEELEQAVEELGGSSCVLAARGSSDDEEHQTDTVRRTIEKFGSLDILVNNAAINPHFGPMLGADLALFRKTLEVNLVACYSWTQKSYKAWMEVHGGTILNVSSGAGLQSGSPLSIYGVTKAALIYMTQQLASELGPLIRVNAIAPGVVKTHFASKLYEADEAGAAAIYPMKRLGTVEDTAKLAAFLLGPDSTWITGTCVPVDGGWSAARG